MNRDKLDIQIFGYKIIKNSDLFIIRPCRWTAIPPTLLLIVVSIFCGSAVFIVPGSLLKSPFAFFILIGGGLYFLWLIIKGLRMIFFGNDHVFDRRLMILTNREKVLCQFSDIDFIHLKKVKQKNSDTIWSNELLVQTRDKGQFVIVSGTEQTYDKVFNCAERVAEFLNVPVQIDKKGPE